MCVEVVVAIPHAGELRSGHKIHQMSSPNICSSANSSAAVVVLVLLFIRIIQELECDQAVCAE